MLEQIKGIELEEFDKPTLLYGNKDHLVYWLGFPEEKAFRTNSYLIVDGEEAVIIDPGASYHFEFTLKRVLQIIELSKVKGVVLCHQDPDVASSLPLWLDVNPNIKVITTQRTAVLLDYYKPEPFESILVDDQYVYSFSSGNSVKFIGAPFLHFPGAFATYDSVSGYLFSGDVFAALDYNWKLIVTDFLEHKLSMDLFHKDYMASNKATKGFAQKIKRYAIEAILPQHGSIIPKEFIPDAIAYLETLKCGIDIIYPE